MKTKLLNLIVALAFSAGIITAAPLGTAFTYQGRLNDGTNAANGSYDLKFTLYDALGGGNAVGGPLTNSATGVTEGLFTVALDFGASAFGSEARWLEIAVRPAGGSAFTPLTPRQPLTSAPYATWATSAATAQTATLAKNLDGPLPGDQLTGTYTGKLNLTNVTNVFFGELYGDVFGDSFGDHYGDSFGDFYGDGYGITHLNASQLAFGTLPDARLSTNVAVLTANQTFSGSNAFNGPVIATNAANVIQGTFAGNGAGLTSLNGVALSAGTVGSAALQTSAVTADKVAAGQVVKSLNNLKDDVVLAAGENIILTTNGNSLQVSASSVAAAWRLAGNPGSNPGTNFIGTTDNQPLEFKVNNQRGLRLEPTANTDTVNVIGGSARNFVGAGVVGATIGGGAGIYNSNASTNRVEADFGTVSGGSQNAIQTNASYASIGGGIGNTIQPNAAYATVTGGQGNTIQPNAISSSIGGGLQNTIQLSANNATIGGGAGNTIQFAASFATIAGGYHNAIGTNSDNGVIGGGDSNNIAAGSLLATIAGGLRNAIGANSGGSVIGGGEENNIPNNAIYATIAGGSLNSATNFAFAAGRGAKANHTGAFVWGDSINGPIASSANNQFTVRASGGARFFSNAGLSAGVSLAAGGTSWAVISDRNVKKNFQPVDSREVLERLAAMPVSRWNYQWESDNEVPHLGPMAQDFKAAFYPGRDDKSITTQEADGVELAAIQGLNQKVEAQRAENAELKQELAELKRLVNQLSAKFTGGPK